MKTLLTVLAFACALTNALLFADWLVRGESAHAALAGLLCLTCAAVACFIHRLRW